ncbi:hypothetical protein [Massilia horti]|uniref:DUF2029 domain-containing protein n=1 Tax=Massilia horti TaxID=2562153 RepID=A0A4Y9T813_9BURK|nr:hypothetical protein [Massilia horti]TFW33639.1 hypothetical protein E4O92_06500 [Massilia horti]
MSTSNLQYAYPAQPVRWWFLVLGFGAVAFLLMTWRWGGTVEDSLAYFNAARYLRGEIPASELRAPFPYRLLVPAVASKLPGDLRHAFAGLNWALVTASACMAVAAGRRVCLGERQALFAGLIMLVSLPTFWYAPYLLVDPGSVCARSAFVLAVLSGQPWLAALAAVMGTAVREENILLLVWLIAARRIALVHGLAALAIAAGWLVAVRWWLIPGLPSYTWVPNMWTVRHALGDVPSLLSLAGCAGLVVPLAIAGWRRAPAQVRPLASLILLMALPGLYAAASVRIDGRIIWGLYPFLIPFAVSAIGNKAVSKLKN